MKQTDIILRAMLSNKSKTWWSAKDFQYGENFVGYEATARMSELANMFVDLIKVAKDGRFRVLAINWDSKELKKELERLELI